MVTEKEFQEINRKVHEEVNRRFKLRPPGFIIINYDYLEWFDKSIKKSWRELRKTFDCDLCDFIEYEALLISITYTSPKAKYEKTISLCQSCYYMIKNNSGCAL